MTTGDWLYLAFMWAWSLFLCSVLWLHGTTQAWRQDAVNRGYAEWTIDEHGNKGWQWLEKPE